MENINNNIKEPICSFEVSNLLKEKGFDVLSTAFYHKTKKELVDPKSYADLAINKNSDFSTASFITAPTQSVAVEWIRVNFGIDIDELKIASLMVDEARTLKRIAQRAKGRANRISKRSCHIYIKLSDEGQS